MTRVDYVVMALVAIAICIPTICVAHALYPYISEEDSLNVWFDADPSRWIEVSVNRWSPYQRYSMLHPLVIPLFYSICFPLKCVGLSIKAAVLTFLAVHVTIHLMLLYCCCRIIARLHAVETVVIMLLYASTSTWMFWFCILESHPVASTAILVALILGHPFSKHRPPIWLSSLIISLSTLGILVTNWIVGFIVLLSTTSVNKTIKVMVYTYGIVGLAFTAQTVVFPEARFIGRFDKMARNYASGRHLEIINRLKVVFVHGGVMPKIHFRDRGGQDRPGLGIQQSPIGDPNMLRTIATVAWLILLGLGALHAALQARRNNAIAVLSVSIIYLVLLFAFFGWETFLYMPNLMALYVLLIGIGLANTNWRRCYLCVIVVAIPLIFLNNFVQLAIALDMVCAVASG